MSISQRIVILGAASAIAEAAARLWAAQGARIALVGHNAPRLEAIADDLKSRGATETTVTELDLAKADAVVELDKLASGFGGLDIVLLAYGVLGDQAASERDPAATAEVLHVNFNSAAAWSQAAANLFETQKSGSLVVLGSVAGDRGRQSNYVYGAAKAGLGVLVEGIAHRLARSGARAVLVKPGFIDTPMTAAFAKNLLWAKPEAIAPVIVSAAEKGGQVVYAPTFWYFIMLVVRNIPEQLFFKTKL
jgi:short-subunit dehydrogenase